MSARYEVLAGWVANFGWTKGAEIGVADGRTLFYLLAHCPKLHMVAVDPWDLFPAIKDGPTKSGEQCRCEYCAETKAARKKRTVSQTREMVCAYADKIERLKLMVMPSQEAAQSIEDGSFDFVFVDGDHSTEGVSADIDAWKSKVKSGGRLCGHDSNMHSVRMGLWSHFLPDVVNAEDDHVWWVQL